MRILVISDSHGRHSAVEAAIESQPSAKHVFFLGDCLKDIEYFDAFFPDRTFHKVRGNCDFSSDEKEFDFITLGNRKILFTHGHGFSVKSGLTRLKSFAHGAGADIVLYGHTHVANTEYADGLYLVNPGSIGHSRGGRCSYAVIDIINSQVMPIIINV